MASKLEPRWDRDYARGEQAQFWCDDVIDAFKNKAVEIKRDDRFIQTGNIYVEFECLKKLGWEKSGIQTTQSLVYAFVISIHHAMIVISTDSLRRIAREFWKDKSYRRRCTDGDHPTKGVVIPISKLREAILLCSEPSL